MKKTAECVTPMHPDKICDRIADYILDAYLEVDKNSRCAIEVMGGHNLIVVNGEVTSKGELDIEEVVKESLGIELNNDDFKIIVNLVEQSPEIANGVDTGGAGDQGIMIGYACNDNEEMVPQEQYLARDLCNSIYHIYPYDGKTQVTIENGKVTTVVASFQNTKSEELLEVVKDLIKADEYLINSAGEWFKGSFEADTGLSGRKIVIDNYGPEVSIGGGSFSGKDYTKVDRSGAYMARKIAVDLLRRFDAKEVYTKLAYAIGKAKPVMATAIIDGQELEIEGYDLTPRGIYKHLKLDEVKFSKTTNWGHFGRGFSWE